jgi:hypothetical protein
VFSDKNVIIWTDINFDHIYESDYNIVYEYNANKEKIIAMHKEIDITICKSGSRFSNEFNEIETQLNNYKLHKVRYSTCPLLNNAWSSNKRIFFIGGDKDIPEKYLQESLHNFIDDLKIIKGKLGQFEPSREHNLGASKPVDLVVRWEKSNRIALIEIKWLGKSIFKGKIKSTHSNCRANQGYKQLKEYFDLAKRDYPNKIIKCYLVVIDGRRRNTNATTTSISHIKGMHYSQKEILIDVDKQYHLTYENFEKPIRMFVEPICD